MGRGAPSSDALRRYLHYVGWSFGDAFPDYETASARLIGEQGPYKYIIAKRGARFRYALFNQDATVHRVVVNDGATVFSSADGKAFSALADHHAFILKAEIAAFFSDFHDYTVAIGDRSDPNCVTLQAAGTSTLDIAVHENGACRAMTISTAQGSQTLVPLQVTTISPHRRMYSTWRRNGELPIRFQRFDAGAKVYDGEITAPDRS